MGSDESGILKRMASPHKPKPTNGAHLQIPRAVGALLDRSLFSYWYEWVKPPRTATIFGGGVVAHAEGRMA
jgi:hypothetical protein